MKDSRLLEIFQQLSKKEIKALGQFVKSPFHNQRADVVALYKYLRENTQKRSKTDYQKAKIFSFIFPHEPYSEKKIRYTMSFLYQCIKEFVAIQEFKTNQVDGQIAVVQSFRKRGATRLFEQEFKIAKTLIEKQALRNQDYHYQNYLLEREHYLFTASQTRRVVKGLENAANHLDQFFIINKLKQTAQAVSYKTLNQSNFQPQLLKPILDFLEQKKIKDNRAIDIYFHCVKILSTEATLPYFQELRTLIQTNGHCFPPRELQDIYSFALNYCIKKLNAQELSYRREAFELYKTGIAQGIFFENGILSPFNYKNIVALGLGLTEYDWVATFIEENKIYLDKKLRESTYAFNLALLHYKKEEYEIAMDLLQKVGSKDVLNNLNARRMLVRIYYDRGEFEALYSLLDSFQNYIYRKPNLGYHRRLYLNFIKFTRKLLQLEGYSTLQIEQLRQEILETRDVAEKVWLLGQL